MSLILQALKKAEAERSLGRVPSLDQVTAAEAEPAFRRDWIWPAAAALGVSVALTLWWALGGTSPAPASPALPTTGPVPTQAPPATTSLPSAPASPATLPTSVAATIPAAPRSPVKRVMPGMPVAPVASAVNPAAQATTRTPPNTVPRPAEPAPPPIHELPVAVRQALPPLPVSGSIWSNTPGDRMLILAGEIRREGDRITPELLLVSIGQRAAVLRFRDQPFSLPY